MTKITLDELRVWRDSLANCAIEDNEYAIEQLKLWDTDRDAFIREYIYQRVKDEV